MNGTPSAETGGICGEDGGRAKGTQLGLPPTVVLQESEHIV